MYFACIMFHYSWPLNTNFILSLVKPYFGPCSVADGWHTTLLDLQMLHAVLCVVWGRGGGTYLKTKTILQLYLILSSKIFTEPNFKR